jgi:hypothetical protein
MFENDQIFADTGTQIKLISTEVGQLRPFSRPSASSDDKDGSSQQQGMQPESETMSRCMQSKNGRPEVSFLSSKHF